MTVFVVGEYASSERRLDRSWTILEVKEKLGPIVGVPVSTMSLVIVPKGSSDVSGAAGIPLADENAYLGAYAIDDYSTIKVIDTNPYKIKNEFSDVSKVQKFEISMEEYEKRTGKKEICTVLTMNDDPDRHLHSFS